MVNGILKVPSFLKRKSNPSQRLDNVESTETLNSSPEPKREERPSAVTANIDIPKKQNRRVRTISGSSAQSSHSEQTPRSRRFGGSGSNFSGDSIVHHLDKLSERDQVWFQAYRFGGR